MPKIIEPTLIRVGGPVTVNATGGTAEMDFDFGNLEGARILGVQYGINIASSVTALVEVGLNFAGAASAPAASDDLRLNENVFADKTVQVLGVTAVGFQIWEPEYIDLMPLNIDILSNISLQAFNTGAVARIMTVKVYYKRLLFSQRELGAQLAVRR